MGCLVLIAYVVVLIVGLGGWGVLLITALWVSLWAVRKWLKRKHTQKEQLKNEKTEIIAMIDEALLEKEEHEKGK